MENNYKRDKNGFIVLESVDDIKRNSHNIKIHDEKPKKIKKLKFKKGSWKYFFYKKIRKLAIPRIVKNFHHANGNNIIIYKTKDDPNVVLSSTRLDKKLLKKLISKYPDAYVLVDCIDSTYYKVSLETYKKLYNVSKIIISNKFKILYDGCHIADTLYENETVIYSINQLLQYIHNEFIRINGVYDLQMKIGWYDWYMMKYKIMVMYEDGNVDYYKGETGFSEFCRKIGIC